MEDFLVFKNPGVLDLNMIRIMGVSVKETDNPIGHFGTGLKYAIATILRAGGDISILTGGEKYNFDVRLITLRGKEFDQVTLNGEPLGFTTELGKQWKPWMAIREIYSNMLDEGGTAAIRSGKPRVYSRRDDETAVIISGKVFVEVWHNRGEYFIDKKEAVPIHATDFAESYSNPTESRAIFYKGIRVGETINPPKFKHNILTPLWLTEDRTILYDSQYRSALESHILASTNPEFIAEMLTPKFDQDEFRLSYDDLHMTDTPTTAFKQTIEWLAEQKPSNLNLRAVRWAENKYGAMGGLKEHEMTKVQLQQLSRAISCMELLGYKNELAQYPIIVVERLGARVLGQAKEGKIFISKDCFDRGSKYVLSTLLEEFVHCHFELRDESRDMQTWLFDKVVTLAEEYILKEAV